MTSDPRVGTRLEPAWRRRLHSHRFVVQDRSMSPAFLPGDRLWVDTAWFQQHPPRPGDVVVVRDPEHTGRLLLKRISSSEVGDAGDATTVRVLGDLREESRDSRAFGSVPCSELLGVVWFRYAPEARRGPV